MNYSTLAFLVNDNVRAINVIYGPGDSRHYTFKTTDKTIVVGDFVAAPSTTKSFKVALCQVVEVDVSVDFDTNINFNWIIQKIDFDQNAKLIEQESAIIDTVRKAELKQRKRSLMAATAEETGLDMTKLTLKE